MCGIVGSFVNKMSINMMKNMFDLFIHQKKRGVDGAGISINSQDKLYRFRSVSPYRLFSVYNIQLWDGMKDGDRVLFHHRFPTSSANKPSFNHPIKSEDGTFHLIHNGVISGYHNLFTDLVKRGHNFETYNGDSQSFTDSEVLVHLIEERIEAGDNMCEALKWLRKNVSGTFSCLISIKGDNRIYMIRNGRELNISRDKQGNYYVSSEFKKMNDLSFVYELVNGEVGFLDGAGYKSVYVPKHEEKQDVLSSFNDNRNQKTLSFSDYVKLPKGVVDLIHAEVSMLFTERPDIDYSRLCIKVFSEIDAHYPELNLESKDVRVAIRKEVDRAFN